MTYDEFIVKKQEDRGSALTAKKGILDTQVQLEEERDFEYRFLFGEGTDEGLNDLFALFYAEAYYEIGRTTNKPSLKDNDDEDWTDRFELCVGTAGDDATGFYPPDAYGVGAKDFNLNSEWIRANGDGGETTGGLVGGAIGSAKSACGLAASENANGRGPFATEELANAHRDATKGTGAYGKRTANSEVYFDVGSWYVGQSGIDTPDYYTGAEKSTFEAALLSLKSELDTYKTQLNTLKAALQKIANGDNALMEEGKMTADMPTGDVSNIDTLLGQLTTHQLTLQDFYDYFHPITNTTSGTRAAFNAQLEACYAELSSISSLVANRAVAVLSTTTLGALDGSSGMRKWRLFWVQQLIGKPQSPIVSLDGIDASLAETAKALLTLDSALNTIFGDTTKYLSTPEMLSVYANPILDEEGNYVAPRAMAIWSGEPFTTKYKIFRKELPATPSNVAWEDVDCVIDWVVTVDPESGAIQLWYDDETAEPGKTYQYRVQAFDADGTVGDASPLSRMDSFNSSSIQSPCYDETKEYSIESVVGGMVTVSEKHSIEEGTYVALVGTAYDGNYLVAAVTETKVGLSGEPFSTGAGGKLYPAKGIVAIPEEEEED